MNEPFLEQRRTPRKRIPSAITVTDVIRAEPMGYLSNLSVGGILLIGFQPPRDQAIYQVSFALPAANGQPRTLEIGIQTQWQSASANPGQIWAGYRIIAVTDADLAYLHAWLALT